MWRISEHSPCFYPPWITLLISVLVSILPASGIVFWESKPSLGLPNKNHHWWLGRTYVTATQKSTSNSNAHCKSLQQTRIQKSPFQTVVLYRQARFNLKLSTGLGPLIPFLYKGSRRKPPASMCLRKPYLFCINTIGNSQWINVINVTFIFEMKLLLERWLF